MYLYMYCKLLHITNQIIELKALIINGMEIMYFSNVQWIYVISIISIISVSFLMVNVNGKSCVKTKSIYHSRENTVENKQSVDYKADAITKYLQIAEYKEKNKFFSEFNWNNISNYLETKFLDMCLKNSNEGKRYKYNYSYKYSIVIYVEKAKTSFLEARKEAVSCVIKNLIMVKDIDKYIINTGNSYKFAVPQVEYVKLLNKECNNVTVSSIILSNFTIHGNKPKIENVEILFEGVSVQEPYMDSDMFHICIHSIIDLCRGDSNLHISILKKVITGKCENNSMSLISEVVKPPDDYLQILKRYSLEDDDNTRLFYYCMLHNSSDSSCLNYISLQDSASNTYIKLLDPYFHKTLSSRLKRSLSEKLNEEDLDCMYEKYEPYNEGTELNECINKREERAIKNRKKRGATSTVSDVDDEYSQIAKYLGVKENDILPGSASHIQLGIYGDRYDTVTGDGAIIDRLSLSARQLFSQYMPNVPADTIPSNVISELDRVRHVTSTPKNPVISGVYSVAANKIESVKSALKKENPGLSNKNELDINSKHIHYLGSNSINTVNDVKKITGNDAYSKFKDRVSSFRHKGGDVVLTRYNQKEGNLLFNVDTSTSIIKPAREFPKKNTVFGSISSLDSTQDNTILNNRKSMSLNDISTCGKFGNSAACALLGSVPNIQSSSKDINIIDTFKSNKILEKKVAKIPITSNILTRSDIRNKVSHVKFLDSQDPVLRRHAEAKENVFSNPQRSSIRSREPTYAYVRGERTSESVFSRSMSTGGGSSGYQGDISRSEGGSVYIPVQTRTAEETRSKELYRKKMVDTAKKFDKTTALATATQVMIQGLINARTRNEDLKKTDLSDSEIVFEAVSSSFSSISNAIMVAGIVASPNIAFAGMGLSLVAGLIDLGKHIYNLIAGKPKPEDPLVKKFNQYGDIVADSSKMGVRTCLMPGSDLIIYLSYRNDTTFKPSLEKLDMHFIDVMDSVVYYLNTSNIIMDYSLTIVCPIGYLRSPDIDVNAYVSLKETREEVRFYQINRLGAMLYKSPIVRFTCGRDITLTLKPFEVPISEMQLLKMATPGEPNETRSIPSNVCDLFPMKHFYLLVKGCPYDSSKIAIAYTTCSILLRMSVWEEEKRRWVLENPFDQKNRFKQLFVFSKFKFNDTVIKPNEIPGHAKFCANRQSNQCHWYDVMVLDDITSCEIRARKIYVEIYLFTGNRGFTSFVLTCPSGSTPVAVGDKQGIIELPFSDMFTVKMFASVKKKSIGVFCVNDYDTRYRSDMIIIKFVEPNFPKHTFSLNTYAGQSSMFNDLVGDMMPYRSRTCSNAKSKACTSYYRRINVWSPNYVVETDIGNELMIGEKYDPESATLENIQKSKLYFPHKLNLEYSLSGLGNVYDKSDRFWSDAEKSLRTFSSILLILVGCDLRKNVINYGNRISVMAYHQYKEQDYGDGKKYTFNRVKEGNCKAELDFKTKFMKIKCEEFAISRYDLYSYEGICAITVTSKDHCAAKDFDDSKKYGYSAKYANSPRKCDTHRALETVHHPDNYCGRVLITSKYVKYIHPMYEACRSYIHIYYRDTWLEKYVLEEPPYAFSFKYNTTKNEYVDSTLSNKLRDLYRIYKELYEYTESTLPKSINRLAGALTSEGRQITNVEVDSNVLEIAYLADMERIAELEVKIKSLSKEILVSTLSDDDIYEIIAKEQYETCCLLDFSTNTSTKVYPMRNYTCGNIEDFIYEYSGENETSTVVLVNGTYMKYDLFGISGASIITCFETNVIPLNINSAKKEVQNMLLLHSVERGLDDLMMELDYNISSILLENNITYIE
ncbi:SWPV1-123 [Shearwaterpox virus]|uniref:SWPV1-123 n=1 Tax=Shearwaterpox virus TaxID=1974596 RepID=A0A1V0S7X1_CNPV|nr:SWPV1-123 [Shearwaterpox virus]